MAIVQFENGTLTLTAIKAHTITVHGLTTRFVRPTIADDGSVTIELDPYGVDQRSVDQEIEAQISLVRGAFVDVLRELQQSVNQPKSKKSKKQAPAKKNTRLNNRGRK